MSFRFPSEQLADLRHHAQLLIERAGDQEGQLEALVAATEGDVRQTEAAISQAAKRLLAGAHQQHAAAWRLLENLNDGRDVRTESPRAVLVVDDYGDVRDVLARVLKNAGFLVRTASNGLEALIAAYEMRPRVIVMDVSMPVLDGIEATRLIKAGEMTRDARVIAYTGNPSFDTSPTRTLFAAVLAKPATPAAVLATVQQVAGL